MASIKFRNMLLSTIPPGSVVLYLGDAGLNLLTVLKPSYGLILHSSKEVWEGSEIQPHLHVSMDEITELPSDVTFDYVIIDDIIPYIRDVYLVFRKIREVCHDSSTVIISQAKRLPFSEQLMSAFMKSDKEFRNYVPEPLLVSLLRLSNFSPRPQVKSCIVADALEINNKRKYSYSIMIPCYNEDGNIAQCIEKIPDLHRDYEIIVVNDGSKDQTANVVRKLMETNQRLRLVDYPQNRGKGYATHRGLRAATKDVFIILDADMTVAPEDLPLFIEPLELGHAEFINGTRMVYPLDDEAMGPVHRFGNKIFSYIFSYLLKQRITDTLCGTKCFFLKDFKRVVMKEEAWPDFDLLFSASLLNLKIVEIPIWYKPRVSGESKMKTIKHGFILLKASLIGFLMQKHHPVKYTSAGSSDKAVASGFQEEKPV